MTEVQNTIKTIEIEDVNNGVLANLYGFQDEHLKLLAKKTQTKINARGNHLQIEGEEENISVVESCLQLMLDEAVNESLNLEMVHIIVQGNYQNTQTEKDSQADFSEVTIQTRKGAIVGRSLNQKLYLHNIVTHDINFGIGPAGTGKTYLAVACAVDAILNQQVQRIILVRPAVEAGERLGFLPGDLSEKVDPYLRPLYDALYEMLGVEKVERMLEKNIIEVAPLAFMRGRTLNNAFVILDEAQNTTIEQMKMFLTRTGFGTTVVVTGDVTQVDLKPGQTSGLKHAIEVLKEVHDISFSWFESKDVVRHNLVQKIINAYEAFPK
ncbi:MAG TPA: PhoH family protein [Gammaproteobacteria bacterium]|nr:PhoH family protein [Xanthomonadales bacterium]MCB1595128.1 PhoH family protein [Xanthomonadales bacterium]HOP22050.1 PhoH family protein [Gammaproteobacteria bacterium]